MENYFIYKSILPTDTYKNPQYNKILNEFDELYHMFSDHIPEEEKLDFIKKLKDLKCKMMYHEVDMIAGIFIEANPIFIDRTLEVKESLYNIQN